MTNTNDFAFEIVPANTSDVPAPVPRSELKGIAEAVFKLGEGEAVRVLEFGPGHKRLWDRNELKATIAKYFGWREGQTIAFRGEGRVLDRPTVVRIRWKSGVPSGWIQSATSGKKDLGDAPEPIKDPIK